MKERIEERQLQGWKFIERFLEVLHRVREGLPRNGREQHGLRALHAEPYLGLFLLGLFNPLINSMRGLCRASVLPRVQAEIGHGVVALSRFSEAQHVFDPELLRRSLSDLLAQSAGALGATCGGFPKEALRIIDSTLWKVVPRMQWATWRHQHVEQRALRLHLKLRVWDEAPAEAKITTGDTCERAALRTLLVPGEIYLGDRNYGGADFPLLAELRAQGCDFLFRLRKNVILHWESTEVLDEVAQTAGLTQAGPGPVGEGRTKRSLAGDRLGTGRRGTGLSGGQRLLGKVERGGGRGLLSPALENRALLPLAQMSGALPALAGAKRARRELPNLSGAARRAVARTKPRNAPQ
jgi:hypothetical protein